MKLPIRLTAAAEQDIILARRWYLEEAPFMVDFFKRELRRVYSKISTQPKICPIVAAGVRGTPLRRFPYSVYYQILSKAIEIVAVFHQARDPRTWRRRGPR